MRLFIALDIPPELKKVLQRLQARLKTCPGRISWVRPANIHLTLKFLGETSTERLPSLYTALKAVSSGIKDFELDSNGLGAFPNTRSPRALCMGLTNSQKLRGLQESIDKSLIKVGFERDKKTFNPHLTICRLRSKDAKRAIWAMAEGMAVEKKVAFVVDRFVLYESILSPAGARYDIIREFPLGEREA